MNPCLTPPEIFKSFNFVSIFFLRGSSHKRCTERSKLFLKQFTRASSSSVPNAKTSRRSVILWSSMCWQKSNRFQTSARSCRSNTDPIIDGYVPSRLFSKSKCSYVMDHSPIRQTFKFEKNFSTVGKSF